MSARLVVIGDSLAQGFRSGSVCETDYAYPAIMARAMEAPLFRRPSFRGQGGMPINLEVMMRKLSRRFGHRIRGVELPAAVLTVQRFMGQVEEYWERGPGTLSAYTGPVHHNLAAWGFQVGDADTLTEAACRRFTPPARDDLIQQIPEFSKYRSARRTLNPALSPRYEHLTQIGAANHIAQTEGGIDNLVVALGSNHCLAAAVLLKLIWSDEGELYRFSHERQATIWTPRHFRAVWSRIAPKIDAVGAKRVLVATVPHVTIAPMLRGVTPGARSGEGRDADGYFEFYTHFWIWDQDFARDPYRFPHLTREQAKLIDAVVDEYNANLRTLAARRGWEIVDLCAALDRISFRRLGGPFVIDPLPQALKDALVAHPGTASLYGARDPMIDTRYLQIRAGETDPLRRSQGGFFSLDGIHPTVTGAALIAREFLEVIGGDALSAQIDWEDIVAADTLLHDTPIILGHLKGLMGFLSSHGVIQRLARVIGWSRQR